MSTRVLLVCPDPTDLVAMSDALVGEYLVLSAESAVTALRLVDRHGPCAAAFCRMFEDSASGMAFAASLSRASPGIAIVALTPPPCPDALLRAAMDGLIHGICLLPLSAEALRDKVCHVLSRCGRRVASRETACRLLTRAERDFLLGRGPGAPCPAAS